MYFITICSKNRSHFFGEIVNGEMELTRIGELANEYWKEIPKHFPHVQIGEFVAMPNHTHGIIIIDKPSDDMGRNDRVKILDSTKKNQQMAKISPKSGSISTIIRSYKSIVSKNARKINPHFAWHPRFHDHIIRNKKSFENISKYIKDNPQNWK